MSLNKIFFNISQNYFIIFIGILNVVFVNGAAVSAQDIGMDAPLSVEENVQISDFSVTGSVAKRNINLTSEELKWLSENKIIKVATGSTFAPIEFINQDNEIRGISGAYLDILSNILDVKFKWVGSHNWEDATAMIKSGAADMVSAGTPSDIRREYLIFTDSFLSVTNVIFGNEKGKIFGSMEGLEGNKLAQVKGYLITDTIKRDYPDVEIIEVATDIEALRLVSSGVVDAYISNIPATSSLIAEEGLTNIVAVGETPYKGQYAYGISTRLPLLASSLQKAMNALTPSEKSEVSRKWLTLKIETKTDYELIWKIIMVVAVVIIIFLIWISKLRREVKHRKEVQKELIQAQERAEIAKAEAETANAAKTTFLANMSHEIRTPLNAIIGFSDAMILGVGGDVVSSKHDEYLNDIKRSGEHLAVVIKEILDLSKIEAGKWTLSEKEFSLDDCIENSIKMLSPNAEQKNIKISYTNHTFLKIFADEHIFQRILINLFSNSIKFTNNNGTIDCVVAKEKDGNIKIKITDNGIGIKADRLNQVLNPFEQGQASHELDEEGTGLGLPIVKSLIELHGGKFILTSEVSVGTCAAIIIPSSRITS